MLRLRVLSGREACKILAAQGFVEVCRKVGTLAGIIRQSGLSRSLFETK